ncbi:MAG: cobalamin B12-binding domain-containing protein [Deltaproteobacteria bacterium]|nr:cobalamin B12-binding domain-containing protein [Deltaproteobacteria bacterium]
MDTLKAYKPRNKIRFVTATSIFDGHDASINIMRRLLQARGAEIIHLGHNRSAQEIVEAAVQEDVQGVAVSCYQGGHSELFPYLRELLDAQACNDVKIFGGGGGVISPDEIKTIESKGTYKIYSPEDGQKIGLDGIIGHMLFNSDFSFANWGQDNRKANATARALTLLENGVETFEKLSLPAPNEETPVLGFTGTGGAGKSSLLDEVLIRLQTDFPKLRVGIICIDPSKKKTGGALLGDRVRINSCQYPQIYLRSFATRGSGGELTKICKDAIRVLKAQGFDLVIVETSGIGQGNTAIVEVSDLSLYVMTPEYGAQTQLEKIDMLDFADFVVINKFERPQGVDAVDQVRAVLRRSRLGGERVDLEKLPIFGTIASRFNDDGVTGLYYAIIDKLAEKYPSFALKKRERKSAPVSSHREALVPHSRSNYLSEIAEAVRTYHKHGEQQCAIIREAEALEISAGAVKDEKPLATELQDKAHTLWEELDHDLRKQLETWEDTKKQYSSEQYTFQVRGKDIQVPASFRTLSHKSLPKIALPPYRSKAEIAAFLWKENLPGQFPYTGGIFPFRRKEEEPKRQFAGEGGPKRTNERFHYLANHDPAKRLSTAFDSITLYGSNPDQRPDIYGKIGESGVSIAHLDDLKLLYKGFDLCAPSTSVSMTINGPAPMILAMFFNAAIDQEIDKYIEKHAKAPDPETHNKIVQQTLQTVRGTVQADILKEDQAQNTCIFSTEFALKLMGDIQEFFVDRKVQNYYAVSISGYHIAEAGANPISQLAFTLANGFTYVEYYLGRGLDIDKFAPNLSFFFSNGIDAEYAVIGRVARRIWAIAMRDVYGANERAQKLKYHVQTSGRSLHAQEMAFNDIRTTLQALMALYDNCNSLHTNAYDEALTTPTEESVRRAMAIQLIINRELGLNQCENVNQGSYFLELLSDLVEEAVLKEFEALSRRGGVLGAMETQYQRLKIQEESIYYEHLKHTGDIPIVGVNTFVDPKAHDLGSRQGVLLTRASYEEKDDQLRRLEGFQERNRGKKEQALLSLRRTVLEGRNVFAELMNTVRYCSLGEITETLYEVGGKYRRAM